MFYVLKGLLLVLGEWADLLLLHQSTEFLSGVSQLVVDVLMGLKVDVVGVELVRLATNRCMPVFLEGTFLALGFHRLDGLLAPHRLVLEVLVANSTAGDLTVFPSFDSHLPSDSQIKFN